MPQAPQTPQAPPINVLDGVRILELARWQAAPSAESITRKSTVDCWE